MLKELWKIHALAGVFDEHASEQILGERTDFFGEGEFFMEALFDLLVVEFGLIKEWIHPKEHLIGDYAQAPYIAFLIVLLFEEDFGGHGEGSAHP